MPLTPWDDGDFAAHGLYGIGVRVGLYLQGLGMIFFGILRSRSSGSGFKLATGSITISILL